MGPNIFTLVMLVIISNLRKESFVNGQIEQPSSGTTRQRTCSPGAPVPVDYSRELAQCRESVAEAKELFERIVEKSVEQIVIEHGYDFERHNVTSQDGYISALYRINLLGGRSRSNHKAWKLAPAVLLFHGLGSCSDAWLFLPSNKNLVFKLADAGYDVWLANGRGTDPSQEHISLDADKDINYWDFSFHEMGVYDLPSITDLILEQSGNEKIFFVGHSQGGALYLIAASEDPELNDKIHTSFLMAPAAYLGQAYLKSLITPLGLLYTPLEAALNQALGGRLDYRRPENLLILLGIQPSEICGARGIECDLCDIPIYTFFDFNPRQANYTNLPNIFKVLNFASFKSQIHYGQNLLSCQFRKYDYGPMENIKRYGTTEPPPYQLGNVRAPLHIYYGGQDSIITPGDILNRLINDLSPGVLRGLHRIQDDSFDHGDFLLARDADVLVYDGLINEMNKYAKSSG